jgi:hypothetical protein
MEQTTGQDKDKPTWPYSSLIMFGFFGSIIVVEPLRGAALAHLARKYE